MKKIASLMSILIIMASAIGVYAFVLNLKLPYTKGEKWTITRGYGINATHKGSDLYALDFGLPYGHTVLAASDGEVVYAKTEAEALRAKRGESGYNEKGYGSLVQIEIGEGLVQRYGHLSRILVAEGQVVHQGEEIGEVGNTGHVFPAPSSTNPTAGKHLHFAIYNKSLARQVAALKPEPMSGYGEGQPKGPFVAGEWYTSDNELFKPNKVLNGPPAAAQPTSRPSLVIRVISWVGEVAVA